VVGRGSRIGCESGHAAIVASESAETLCGSTCPRKF
jgi:hypothetical protein